MSENSKIEWTDHTFNPWWGCVKVSEGCRNCYAETFAKRVGQPVWGPASTTPRRFFGEKHWQEPLKWNAAAEKAGTRPTVFCASMADVFEDHTDVDEHRQRLWDVIAETPRLTWQLLTKRPENIMGMVPMDWTAGHWPDNVWMGTSTEDQRAADERIPHLLQVPAPVRFLSCEPLLGPVVLEQVYDGRYMHWLTGEYQDGDRRKRIIDGLSWVIVGGESGPNARPLDLDWARGLRDQCVAAEVAFHFKQVGGRTPKAGGRELDGRTWDQFPAVSS